MILSQSGLFIPGGTLILRLCAGFVSFWFLTWASIGHISLVFSPILMVELSLAFYANFLLSMLLKLFLKTKASLYHFHLQSL